MTYPNSIMKKKMFDLLERKLLGIFICKVDQN